MELHAMEVWILDICGYSILFLMLVTFVLGGVCAWDRRAGDSWRVMGLWLVELCAYGALWMGRWLFRI